jgi:hypothetical protein
MSLGLGAYPTPGKIAPSARIVKANKTFVCYTVVEVLWMLYDNGCDRIEGLQTIMSSCDASILEDLPD